jgi:hypothetical protein
MAATRAQRHDRRCSQCVLRQCAQWPAPARERHRLRQLTREVRLQRTNQLQAVAHAAGQAACRWGCAADWTARARRPAARTARKLGSADPSFGMSLYVLPVPARPASPLATATKALMARFAAHVSHNRHHRRWRAGNLDAKAKALRRMPSPWMMKRLGKPPRSLKLLAQALELIPKRSNKQWLSGHRSCM